MRKELDIAGLEGLDRRAMMKTNGGSNAKAALTAALALVKANGANQHAIDALTKNIAKHP
jgi:hypothetical protein